MYIWILKKGKLRGTEYSWKNNNYILLYLNETVKIGYPWNFYINAACCGPKGAELDEAFTWFMVMFKNVSWYFIPRKKYLIKIFL